MRLARFERGLISLILVALLAPLSAHAADNSTQDGNQAAIDALKAEQQWLSVLPPQHLQALLAQREVQNARVVAQLLSWDPHAQSRIPNTEEQYRLFCAAAIGTAQANLVNAQAMLAARPWDAHAQDEVANASERLRQLWQVIGDTYPGNPYTALAETPPADVAVEAPADTTEAPPGDEAN